MLACSLLLHSLKLLQLLHILLLLQLLLHPHRPRHRHRWQLLRLAKKSSGFG
ncbi:hypothetical protein ACFS07_09010 [Undibacterium arcticum]